MLYAVIILLCYYLIVIIQDCLRETESDLIITPGQNEDVAELKKKSEKYDEIVAERNDLRNTCEGIELWKERFENGHKRLFNELKTTCDVQLDKLKKAMDAKYEWDIKLRELQNINDCVSNQMKNLRLNEDTLKSKLADYRLTIQQLKKDLNCAKVNILNTVL